MEFLLDTNACIRYLNGRSTALMSRISGIGDDRLAVCSVVRAELVYGAQRSRDPAKSLELQQRFLSRFFSLPFDDIAANEYGRIRAELERGGTPIGANDMLIAAIALANDLTLVTHNTGEFGRVPGLRVEDWEA